MPETSTPPAELALMQRVKSVCGSWIDEAVAGTPYPAALLAALAANETGGDPTKSRFESNVFGQLCQVVTNGPPFFGSIERSVLLFGAQLPGGEAIHAILYLRNLATSWGPTQIMGYQAIAGKYDLAELTSLNTHFHHTIEMLEGFRKSFHLLTADPWDPFFRCWNTGRPDGKTFDPAYTANGLARIQIYESL